MATRNSHPNTLPVATPPSPAEVDAVASFVETAEDLVHEPFMAEDENRGFSVDVDKQATYRLGDRTHFRSALISFRRLWMSTEPSCYKNVCNLLFLHHEETRIWTEIFRGDIDKVRKGGVWLIPELRATELIELWINTVFAHAGLKPAKKISRKYFDELVSKYGLGKMEYGFRMAVFDCSLSLINLCIHAARPALDDWISKGLQPGFSLSSPFGRKMKERLADGTVIIRQASTKYYTEETLESRFLRILERQKFDGIKFVFKNLDASITGKCLLMLKVNSIREVLEQLDYSYEELSDNFDIATLSEQEEDSPQSMLSRFQAFSGVAVGGRNGPLTWKPIGFGKNYIFYASKTALSVLDEQLARFVQKFQNEG